jgi:hypothetical protein
VIEFGMVELSARQVSERASLGPDEFVVIRAD